MVYKIPAKLVYKKLGVKHISFDINGRFGSKKINFNKPINSFESFFDVVTDYGTLEHITNQYMSFKNIHHICKTGGVTIHLLPLKENWARHGLYEYTEDFFKSLAKLAGYKILRMEILNTKEFKYPKNILAVSLIKTNHSFPSEEKFERITIIKNVSSTKIENYEKKGIYIILSTIKTWLNILKWRIVYSSPTK